MDSAQTLLVWAVTTVSLFLSLYLYLRLLARDDAHIK